MPDPVGTFQKEKLTKTFRPSGRGSNASQQNVDMMKSARAGTLAKDFPNQPSQAEIEQLVENQNTDLVLRALAPVLEEKYKQTIAARSGEHTLTTAEKEALAQQIIAAMLFGKPATPWFAQLVDIAVRLKADFDVPMPATSKAAGGDLDLEKLIERVKGLRKLFDPATGELRKSESYGVMAQATEAIEELVENLRSRKAVMESDDLRKVNDVRTSSLAAQVEELTKRVVAIIKAKTGAAPASAAPVAKTAPTPRFRPLQTGERAGFQPQGDATEGDAATKASPKGARFVPQHH